MALGTLLTGILDVSTTAGHQTLTFNGDGIAATQELIGSNLTVCLMGYHFDYSNNTPTQDGDDTSIKVYYSEYSYTSRDPKLDLVFSDSSTATLFSMGSGDDDDAWIINQTVDGSVSWDTIRGDETTTGSSRNDSSSNYNGVVTEKVTGRGSDVITRNTRSYFVFSLSHGSLAGKTITSAVASFYLDAFGSAGGDFRKVVLVQATALAGSTADYGNCFVADAVAVTDNATFFGANF